MPGSSRLESLIFGCISMASNRSSGADCNNTAASSGEVPLTSSHAAKCSSGSTTGMRSCSADTVRFEGQVRIATVSIFVALPVTPALVNPGKGNQMRLTRAKQERASLALLARPFVEAVGRDEATAPAHGITKRCLRQNIFRPRIDQGRELLRIPHERRQQAPAHEPEAADPFPVAGDHGNGLSRRDVVARGEV